MSFQVRPLRRTLFAPLFDLPADALADHRAVRVTATAKPGFPCRVSLTDAEPGEILLLVNYEHQPANSPYRASHAVYVRKTAEEAQLPPNVLPPYFTGRQISLRAFDEAGMIVDAELVDGDCAEPVIETLLALPDSAYLHAHFAKYGCFACRIER